MPKTMTFGKAAEISKRPGTVHGFANGFGNPIMTAARAVALKAKLAVVEKQKATEEKADTWKVARESDPVLRAALEGLLLSARS